MPTVENFIDIFDALSRKDWNDVKAVADNIYESERKKKHYNAATRIKEAADIAINNNLISDTFVMSEHSLSAPPIDLLERFNDINAEKPVLPKWMNNELALYFREWNMFKELKLQDIKPRNTLLLHGLPGCGKTMLAKYIASEMKRELYTVRFDSLISSYLGETGENIRKIFSFLKTNNCILFLDEIDAIAKLRDDKSELGELKRVVISLLQNIDSLPEDRILIAATNHAHMLDPAIWRRFDVVWELIPPKDNVRDNLLETELGESYSSSEYKKEILELTAGMTGADLNRTINESKRRRLIEKTDLIESFLLSTIENARRGDSNQSTNEGRLIQAIKCLKLAYKKKYTYSKLEDITGISHSTIHHKIKSS